MKAMKKMRHVEDFSRFTDGWNAGMSAAKEANLRDLNDSRPITIALLAVLRAIDSLARNEQQRVVLAVNDLLALDRPVGAP